MPPPLMDAGPDLTRLYNEDFFEWTRSNGKALRKGMFEQVDVDHIAEEIEDLGKRDLRKLDSRVRTLIVYLLKWRFQPEHRRRSWEKNIAVQRSGIVRLLRESPSLRRDLEVALNRNYKNAVRLAAIEMDRPADHFPGKCSFTVEQILDPDFLP